MIYEHIVPAIFLRRPSRFTAIVELNGREEQAHLKNTARLTQLLTLGARVILQRAQNPARKTQYDLISVYHGEELVNIDSNAPNKVCGEWIVASGHWGPVSKLRPESTWGNSRFDFFVEAARFRGYVEAKGVTLRQGKIALFPDAPTARGVKHAEELMACKAAGYDAAIIFIAKMTGIACLRPNDTLQPAFGEALRRAAAAGVEVLALGCTVREESLVVDARIPVQL